MTLLNTRQALVQRTLQWRVAGEKIALVPTMGALHEGHMTLVRTARRQADRVVVSIFVNPTQFAPHEDFDQYPRQLEQDARLALEAGADTIYAPAVSEMYPTGDATRITVSGVSEPMEGTYRPHFFTGVATVVARLLIHVAPDLAFFGEKDFQQLQVVRRMVTDLALPVTIIGVPTVREADGLAMSSRNAYLSDFDRAKAPIIYQQLCQIHQSLLSGKDFMPLQQDAVTALTAAGFDQPDYLDLRRSDDLSPLPRLDGGAARLLIAVRLGKTRLIDNIDVTSSDEAV